MHPLHRRNFRNLNLNDFVEPVLVDVYMMNDSSTPRFICTVQEHDECMLVLVSCSHTKNCVRARNDRSGEP